MCDTTSTPALQHDMTRSVVLQVALKLLLQYALKNPEVQLILLSPQDIDAMHQVRDDVRRQQPDRVDENFAQILAMPAARPTGGLTQAS